METFLERTELLFSKERVDKLKKAHVAVFGLGGVGGYAAEALTRSGIGFLDVFDADTIKASNLNRQILALHSTLEEKKVDVFYKRAKDINPNVQIQTHDMFVLPENIDSIDFKAFDYVVDAIDTISAKLAIIERCKAKNVPIICAMGTGNKFFPEFLEVTDIFKTSVCPLSRVMRQELKKRGIKELKVVYSKEPPKIHNPNGERQPTIGSNAFVPATAGLLLASTVVRELMDLPQEKF